MELQKTHTTGRDISAKVRPTHDYYLSRPLNANSEPKAINELLSDELVMTFAALKKHPKVYWIWNHRRWCLENIPVGGDGGEGDEHGWRTAHWGRELLIVEKMLEADARNCA